MVKTMHSNGIEVILDVVYNHTAEGNQMGPTLFVSGASITWRTTASRTKPLATTSISTGCGNTFRMQNPHVLHLSSTASAIGAQHACGRFSLRSGFHARRELHEVNMLGGFFDIMHQDPVLSQVKLIAEPWDLGQGGYLWATFRPCGRSGTENIADCIRKFWKGDGGTVSEFATRFTGSSDLYEWSSRRPHASINFVTCTMASL